MTIPQLYDKIKKTQKPDKPGIEGFCRLNKQSSVEGPAPSAGWHRRDWGGARLLCRQMSWLDPPSAWRSPTSATGSTTLPWRTPSATDPCSAALLFPPRESSPATLVISMFRHWSCLPGEQVNQPLLTHHTQDKNFWTFTSWEVQVRTEARMIMQFP